MSNTADPFVPLRFGELFSRSFILLRERPGLFLSVGTVWYILSAVLLLSFPATSMSSMADAMDGDDNTNEGGQESDSTEQGLVMLALVNLEIFLSTLISILLKAAISIAVAIMYNQGNPDAITCSKKALSKGCGLFCGYFCTTLGLSLVMGIIFPIMILLWLSGTTVLQLLVALIAVAIVVGFGYVTLGLSLFVPTMMIEQKGPIEGIKRSFELLSKGFFHVLFTYFCLSLAGFLVFSLMDLLPIYGLLGAVVKNLPNLVLFPYGGILATVVYLNIRVSQEGLTREMLTDELNVGSPHDQYVATGDVEANTFVKVDEE